MQWSVWITLFLAAWAISLSPGPGAVASMSSGLRYGFKRGYLNAIGLAIGYAIQFFVSVVGLGALLSTAPTAFHVLQWLGIAYLCYLGIKQFFSKENVIQLGQQANSSFNYKEIIWQGILVNLTNPKGIVFLLAVVPQFLDLNRPHAIQYIIICFTLCIVDLLVMAVYTGTAAKIMQYLKKPSYGQVLNRLFGLLFIVAAIIMMGIESHSG